MSGWPRNASVYEINTWVWLRDLAGRAGKPVDLAAVPAAEWDAVAQFGFDAVWLMGVWERSPASVAIANRNDGLLADFRRALPDFRPEDNVGSAYSIRNYLVDPELGGSDGLAVARQELARRGLRLLLDFVPNHVAVDHPWTTEHPEYFVHGSVEEAVKDPVSFVEVGTRVLACGKDPYFPAWADVLQVNPFCAGLRRAAFETVTEVARQCDGVRCDMAMLLLNSIFEKTWGERAGARPKTEYWTELIGSVKQAYPEFLFLAEAYWDLEWELQQQGFDLCYDKRLLDRLEHGGAEGIRQHLQADVGYQNKLLRFIENHDEARAAAVFPGAKEKAAALTAATLPGAKLFYEGQMEGRKVRLPVFLARRTEEAADKDLQAWYAKLLTFIRRPALREGDWSLCLSSHSDLLAWSWTGDHGRVLIVVNLSESAAQGHVQMPWEDLGGATWQLQDPLTGADYLREGDEMSQPGLCVALESWGRHCFEITSVRRS